MRAAAIVGATGLVGRTILKLLEERDFPVKHLSLYASGRTDGRELEFRGKRLRVESLGEGVHPGVELAFFSAGSGVSREVVPGVVDKGAMVIDNSSAFRMDGEVPLVVPEVNPERIAQADGLIANPNCSTIQLVVVLAPLRRRFGLERVVVSTYQSVSGRGFKGITELEIESEDGVERAVFPRAITDNLIPLIGETGENGYCTEETKLMLETRKILGDDRLRVCATAVRVPIRYCHSESVNLELGEPADLTAVKRVLRSSPSVRYCEGDEVPTPRDVVGSDDVWVGRLRSDPSRQNCINMWIVADNVRKGAALNAVQIAEMVER
jgi:aspartate-semialdehyde dehydrogenase